MGASESVQLDEQSSINKIQTLNNQIFYNERYNLIPSFPGFEFKYLDMITLKRKFNLANELPNYIDLRNNFPQIQNMNQFPFNPIISVVYLLHYQLLRSNSLPIFPPSAMFIYRNIKFYKNVKSLLSLESIFMSIKENGICSENQFPTTNENLVNEISGKLYEQSNAFKFIDIYRVEQNLETLKALLNNKYPLLIGFSVYYDLNNIETYMWMPDEQIDKKLGGISGVLVGYIEERKMFIMASTFGQTFGQNGYILIPYDYVLNKNLTYEIYTLDFIKERVEGYINQRKEIVNLENNIVVKKENNKKYKQDDFGSLFR